MRYKSVFFVSLLYHSLSLWGTDYTWNVDAGGSWETGTNWSLNTGYPASSTDTATFGSTIMTNPITVTISGPAGASELILSPAKGLIIDNTAPNYLLLGAGSATQNIVATGSQTLTISAPIVLLSNIVINQGSTGTLTLSGGISDGGNGYGVTQSTGTGTVVILGTNSYTGTTNVNAGTLQAGAANTFASGSNFVVNAIMSLNNFANTINSLSGSNAGASVTTGGSGGILTITHGSNGSVFPGVISGLGGLNLTGGTLSLTGSNTYRGSTTVGGVATLQAGSTSALAPSSDFTVDGTLDLQTYNNTIHSLLGSGSVTTTGATLTVSNGGDFTGGILGNGGLTLTSGTLSLTGSNTFTGITTISAGTLTLSGGGQLSSGSAVVDNGTFDISGISPAISTNIGDLSGNGVINLGNNKLIVNTTLTTPDTFTGSIHGLGGGLEVAGGGTLILGAPNASDYTGATIVDAGATLQASVAYAFDPASDYTVNGMLALNDFSNTIKSLSGSAPLASVATGGVAGTLTSLTITNGSNAGAFAGGITGAGGINLTGGTLNLTTATSANNYSGTTTINNAVLESGAANAFSANSAVIVENTGLLDLLTYSNTISGLSGDSSGVVHLGNGSTLTINPNGGTFAGNIEGVGSLILNSPGQTLFLSGNNSFIGDATITAGTLELTGAGQINSTHSFTVNGTFDIKGISSTSTIINDLSGTGTISLGGKQLVVNENNALTYSGTIQGSAGSLKVQGTSELTLSGMNSYTGPTDIVTSATLQAGSTSALAPSSDFTVDGTLDLQTYNNTIHSLLGSGSVTSSGATLTVSNGGYFTGVFSGTGSSLTLNGGNLSLTQANTYTGTTTINTGTLLLSGAGALNSTSPLLDNGTFDISGISSTLPTSIGDLSGHGVIALGNKTLRVNTTITDTFTGSIHGLGGGLEVAGVGTLILGAPNASDYTGATIVDAGATLQASVANAFDPASDYTVNGTLSLNDFSNTIKSLSGSAPLASVATGGATGILTITNGSNAGAFAGGITGAGGINLTGGTLNLTTATSANNYSGTTTINNAVLESGAANAFSANSAVIVENTGLLDLLTYSNTISGLSGDSSGVVHLGNGSTLTINPNGGTFAGNIEGVGSLVLNSPGQILSLSGDNSFIGSATITAGTLELTGVGQIDSASSFTVNGILDISGINSSTSINDLSGTGTILLGGKQLVVNENNALTYSGTIQGSAGSLKVQGTSELTLSGINSYTGPTDIATSATLQAGSTSALAPSSDFTVDGTLDLQTFNNTIHSLLGSGSVTSSGATLTVSNGGDFTGVISGTGSSLTLNGGNLSLTQPNTYTGTTTINAGTLLLSGAGALNSTSPLVDNGTFDISGISSTFPTSIGDLSGHGVIALGNKTLRVNTIITDTFNGSIRGDGGGLEVAGTGTLILGASSNTYTGATTVDGGATLQAAVANAFAPASDYTVIGTLVLQTFNNQINSLLGSGSVTSTGGLLTISDGGSFSGGITGAGGLTLTGGTLDLTTPDSANNYSGTTTINNAILEAGAANAFSANSPVLLQSGGRLNLNTYSNSISGLSGDSSGVVLLGDGSTLTISPNGGAFAGNIEGGGSLILNSPSKTLSLSGNNSFTGDATITAGTLELSGDGQIDSASSFTVDGTFDIQGISSDFTNIHNLSGSNNGIISLGGKQLRVNENNLNPLTYAGTILGPDGGSLTLQGTGELILSGTSSYTGPTDIVTTATLQAGSTSALAPLSRFTVDGTLALQTYNNTIMSLFGDGSVTSTGATLTLSNGGSFSGGISGSGGLTLAGGTLTLSTPTSANTYFGPTQVAANTTLDANATNALSANSDMILSGSLFLNGFANTIKSLSGPGMVNTGTPPQILGILTISDGSNEGTFSGGITGSGGLNLTGGTLKLATPSSQNIYTGPTTLTNDAILQAEALNAFSAVSDYTLSGTSTLDLNGFSNTILSLTSLSAGSKVNLGNLATLTINGGKTTIFDGQIGSSSPNCGALTINGGTNLTLSNSTNNYCGPTNIVDGTLQINANGALAPLTDITISPLGVLDLTTLTTDNTSFNSAHSVANSGVLSTQEPLTLSTTYTQTVSGLLDLQFESGAFGQILAGTGITLAGTLDVAATGMFPTTGIYTLLHTTSGVVTNTFSTFTPSGFGSSDPLLAYSLQSVDLYFSFCNASWQTAANGNWGDGNNWTGGCVPGANGNQNDTANFPTISGAPNVIVTLANAMGMPGSFTLFQLNLASEGTSYTINQLSSATTITFDATSSVGTPQINVTLGSHIINAPLILDLSTELVLSDMTQLTFNSNTSITSATTQNFNVRQSNSSTTGSGKLTNNTVLTPYTMSITSATVQNNNAISPLTALTIGAAEMGQTATVINGGTGALLGPTGVGAIFQIGGVGTTVVTNNGAGASLGPSGTGGNLIINGSGSTTVTNTGINVKMGAFGNGGNVTVSAGIVNNANGALFEAGSGGVFTLNGGTINNDLTSTVGSTTANLTFTSGLLDTSGDVLAFNYVQSGSSNLQVNLSSIPTIFGNVAASGTAMVGSTLTVNAFPGSVTVGETVDLVTAQKGVSGTYSTVNFLNFPAGIIPEIIYTPNAVELVTGATVTPTASGSLAQIQTVSINEISFLIQRELHDLHDLIIKRKKKKKKKRGDFTVLIFPENGMNASIDSQEILASSEDKIPLGQLTAQNTSRQEHSLAERVGQEEFNPTRFYLGPIDNIGHFEKRSTAQAGFDYNSVGLFTGLDHAADNVGIGFAANYQSLSGQVNHHAGHFHVNQIQGNLYATFVPPSSVNFAVDAIVGYGYDWFDIQRKAGPSQKSVNAKANTHGSLLNALIGAEYIYTHDRYQRMPENMLFTPFVNLQYIGARINGFNEHHAGTFDLHVQSQHINSLRSSLGARLEYLVTRKNFTFKPELDLGWQYEFMDHRRKLDFSTLNLANNHTVSKVIHGAGRNTLLLGVDFFFTLYKVFEIEMSYDLQWNSLYTNNAFYLGIGGNF